MKEYRVRAFKGVWINADIWLNKDLTMIEKVLIAEVDSFCNSRHSCYASNKHFSEFLGISASRVSHVITSLIERGYLNRQIIYDEDGKTIKKRLLSIAIGYSQNQLEGIAENSYRGIAKNSKENNTYINNKDNNNILSSKLDFALAKLVKDVIDYLNDKAGKSYKATTGKNKKLISARAKEGFSLADFQKVIDTKVSQWLNTEMEKYLRPETLFGTKFEGYLQEKAEAKKEPPATKMHYADEDDGFLDFLERQKQIEKMKEGMVD